VLAGMGIGRLSRSIVQDELAAGTLKPLLSEFTLDGDERTVWILYSGQPHMAIAVRRFVDFVVARYHQSDPQSNATPRLSVGRVQHLLDNSELLPDSICSL
jgi:DNA-binding transcriptional LysR family regulator